MAISAAVLGTSGGAQNSFIGSLNATGSHTGTNGDPVILGYTSRNGSQTRASQTTRTVTLGGVAMSLLGFIEFASDVYSEFWSGVCNGSAQTTSVTVGNGTNTGREIILESVSYSGVASIGALTTNSGSGTAATVSSIASAAGEVVVGMFGSSNGALSAFTPNSLHVDNTGDNFANMILGDAPGAASVNIAATRATSGAWGGLAVRLIPVLAASGFFEFF